VRDYEGKYFLSEESGKIITIMQLLKMTQEITKAISHIEAMHTKGKVAMTWENIAI
jgi:hypothetical protein